METITQFFVVTQAILILICLFLSHLVAGRMVTGIVQLKNQIKDISAKKDVTLRLPESRGPRELSDLTNSFNDVLTALHSAQDELVEAKRDQAEVAIVKQVAHDIRAPLTALQVVKSRLTEVPVETAELLNKACDRIQEIADDLMSRQRSHRVFEPPKPILLVGLVHDSIEESKLRTPDIDIKLIADAKAYHCFASVNPSDFRRVLSNIINNSVEACGPSPKVRIQLEPMEEHLSIFIDDNGPGFSSEVLGQIGQLELSSKPNGNGLGLLSVYEHMRRWNGKIWVENLTPGGARVVLQLPLARRLSSVVADLHLLA